MRNWLVVLLAVWLAYRINARYERLWAGNLKALQERAWGLTEQGTPLVPKLSNNKHVLRASN